MARLSIKELPIEGKRVLLRVDFNVPLDKNGQITDDSRIEASLSTIRYILDRGGFPIIMSHLGRPKGSIDPTFSLSPCSKRLSLMLGKPVVMAPDCVGERTEKLAAQLKPGECLLLENLRFHPEEEKPEENLAFAKALARLGDLYVNDAFGSSHRVHTSTVHLAELFRGRAAAGFLLEKEIEFLGRALLKPRRPFCAVIGGAKVSTKIGVIKALLGRVDLLLIGGAMAYTFLKAQGVATGSSLIEPDFFATAREIMESFKKAGADLRLPVDHMVVPKIEEGAPLSIADNREGIPEGFSGVDIGPRTLLEFKEEIAHAKTIFWNGPLGIFEYERFSKGTEAIAEAIGATQGTKVVGGGDSIAAVRRMNLLHRFSHVSTGGGASLEFIEQGTLPAIKALEY